MNYSAIYADPAWGYNDRAIRGGTARHYRALSLSELCDFKVGGRSVAEIATPDAALFLWSTWPMLREALVLITAWGFTYKTCAFTWVKTTKSGSDAVGCGHYTRANTEPCLLAVRGRVKRIDAGVRQVLLDGSFTEESVLAPRGRHSAKPPEVRNRIVRLLGDVPRIELFARERVPGWDADGNELGCQISDFAGGK